MNKTPRNGDKDTMRSEYDFSKGARGKYAKRYAEGSNVVVLDPDLLKAFPNSAAVNRALRALVASRPTRRRKSS